MTPAQLDRDEFAFSSLFKQEYHHAGTPFHGKQDSSRMSKDSLLHPATYPTGIIDVFAHAPLEGNPLAVVEQADALSGEQMRRIAGEFNQAETTFILASTRADRRLRSFTASGAEVFGAGHNALGAWLWLGERGAFGDLARPVTLHQEIGEDVLPITLERIDGRVRGTMRQAALRLFPPLHDLRPLALALGLTDSDLLTTPAPRPADTGATHLLVRARNPAIVDQARPDAPALLAVLQAAGAEGCYLYAFDPETGATPMRAFSTPPSACGRTRPPAPPPGRWRPVWPMKGWLPQH
jgi:PhzF family phenazine biosynthesis protein